ncbi:sigma-54 dependent transcriptional regulator [Desulfatitalea alkaliphila]|uniref:Sigma-54 dependent transcriptional regulator n=1 Tax=Desulfatitalea alkaliphila TaxID=2929485 RepID=A0AA41UIZ9_9BACT|nr:sigma-54 dependent transcriptional regulator [Desulfatitalea alkaliphila]MCJ8501315.1 sigma-54 dependent transcriptional regulator [Desulfatitalea alkaliphila]
MAKQAILIISESDGLSGRLGGYLESCGFRVVTGDIEGNSAAKITDNGCDLVVLGLANPAKSGADWVSEVRTQGVAAPLVVVAEGGSVRDAVAVVQAGAADYFSADDDPALIAKGVELLLKHKGNGQRADLPESDIAMVTREPAMDALLAMAGRIAASPATVLIQGESGTGKEMLARFIHAHSGRGQRPMVAMNCSALPDTLAESELFGYERGAFTGALQRKTGRFEQAHQGTLLLDEISELPLPLQAKLLRVLQEKVVDRIGGNRPVPVDVRVIATTNRDLAAMVREGTFRQDLYYRLRIVPLVIPPLRARTEDIAALSDHFIAKHSGNDVDPTPRFNAAAMAELKRWHWPGNVRELENTIQRALLIRDGAVMGPELLLLEEGLGVPAKEEGQPLVGMTVKDLEERLIVQTLDHVNQNRTHAAEMLGISIRTLRNKLREYRTE